jgi:ATP-dependent DNA ligase
MLAKSVSGVPGPDKVPGGLAYEPKWDGFRCIVFRDADEVVLGSRNEKPLTRYFPELVHAVRANLPPRCVVDAEIVVAVDGRLQFERLQDRIHPADSRVRMLAETTPATLVVFDLLALGDEALLDQPYSRRRELLDDALGAARAPVFVTPVTRDHGQALDWFRAFEGAGLDGIVCKPLAGPYEPDRRAMLKVKHDRTADCVVAGYRLHKTSTPQRPLLGSLLLGLYDDEGGLAHVGVSASFSAGRRAELFDELQPLTAGVEDHPWAQWQEWAQAEPGLSAGRRPGNVSRWNAGKDLTFVALRPERVVEVAYDHMEGTRFRHTAQFRRWRPDRDPRSCTFEQLEEPVSYDLAAILPGI